MFIHIPAKGQLNECIVKIKNILETIIEIHMTDQMFNGNF